jgi:hypothetical protein
MKYLKLFEGFSDDFYDNYYYIIRLLEPKKVGNEIIYATDKETGKEFVNELRNTFPEYAEKLDYTKW